MKFILEIDMANAVFAEPFERLYEAREILEKVRRQLTITESLDFGSGETLRDTNGNVVGFWKVVEAEDEPDPMTTVCWVCEGTGILHSNGESCTRCAGTGWLQVQVVGVGR